MSTEEQGPTLHVHVMSGSAELPTGMELRVAGDTRACLQLADSEVRVHVALEARARTEMRWLVDGIIRRVGALTRVGPACIHGHDGVDDDTLVTLGLDLYRRCSGAVEIAERPALQARVKTTGALLDQYCDWINEDPATRTSLAIARDVANFGDDHATVNVDVLAEAALTDLGLRLLLAVGAGSPASPPRLVIARYRPPGCEPDTPYLMLLGKGITFDSGGINVKPYESFVSMMKNDMGGAALAFALFRGLVEAGHDQPLLLVLPTCENAVDGNSMRPGALVTSYRGHRVRIDHTDAEGRLALADGLAYASQLYPTRQVLSFATLTTSALVSYGPYATPVHFADSAFEGALRAASEATGEDLHFFPERIWHSEANRDQEADLRNTARLPGHAARGAGSRNAAHFLRFFTDAPLCHFDIFGSTWNWAGDAPGAGYGATGAPLRTLLRAFGVG